MSLNGIDFIEDLENEDLNGLLDLYSSLNPNDKSLRSLLPLIVKEHILFWILGENPKYENFNSFENHLRNRVNTLGLKLTDKIITSLTKLYVQSNFKANKKSISDISTIQLEDLLKKQGYRCRLCGIPFRSFVCKKGLNHPNYKFEPHVDETLDHKLPFYIAGNTTEYQLLCNNCNSLKLDKLGLQEESGLTVCNNSFNPRSLQNKVIKKIIFWQLTDAKCSVTSQTSSESMMFCRKIDSNSPWFPGNIEFLSAGNLDVNCFYVHDL